MGFRISAERWLCTLKETMQAGPLVWLLVQLAF